LIIISVVEEKEWKSAVARAGEDWLGEECSMTEGLELKPLCVEIWKRVGESAERLMRMSL
jgi:hypothetical protein